MRILTNPSRLFAIAPSLAAAFLLGSCGQDGPPPLPPVAEEALAAVVIEPGVPREALARTADALFTRDDIGETRALLIMYEGEIVAERYGEDFTAQTPQIGWSMAKTVTGVLVGMMVADGKLALDSPAPIANWQRPGDPHGEITLRHLMQMRSGIRHDEKAEPIYESPEVQMMFLDGRDNMAGWAKVQPMDHEAGSTFSYSSATSVILADIATDLIASSQDPQVRQDAMAQFLKSRLAVPLEMETMRAEYDASGTLIGGSAIWANARDWGKFGEFLRRRGSVKGAQIVPASWIDFMVHPSPVAGDYGGQVWLNRPTDSGRDVLFAARGPADAFSAVGHLGQYIIVSPSQKLTIVRLGKTDSEDRDALVDALADIAALYPKP